MADRQPQGDGGEDGSGHGDNDLVECGKLSRAVDHARVLQILRDGLEVVADQNHVIRAHQTRQDHGGVGVHQVQVAHQQVAGDQAAGEVHGKHDAHRPERAVREIALGEHVRAHRGHEQLNDSAQHGADERRAVARPDVAAGKHALIGGEVQRVRPQVQAAARGV